MGLVEARNELARRLGSLAGLRVYELPPETAPELPAAIIRPGQPLAEYNGTLGGGDVAFNFAVLLLTGSGDAAQAWDELASYLAPDGKGSVKAAVETATGGSNDNNDNDGNDGVDWLRVTRADDGGRVVYNQTGYWGATFHVQAYVSG